MTYKQYLKENKAHRGQYNPFLMTAYEFNLCNRAKEDKRAAMERHVENCQAAYDNAINEGLNKDAEHALTNLLNAKDRLDSFSNTQNSKS